MHYQYMIYGGRSILGRFLFLSRLHYPVFTELAYRFPKVESVFCLVSGLLVVDSVLTDWVGYK